jgi:sugar phosphate isomerase/epimerase
MMSASNPLPILGAGLTSRSLAQHRAWIMALQRDVEIQDFISVETLQDWRPRVAEILKLLDGHTGRRGIHGPFLGFRIDSQDSDIRAVISRRLVQGIDVCEALGATQMVIHSPLTTWDHNNLPINAGTFETMIERVALVLRPAIARAEAFGCELVIENIEDKDPFARGLIARGLGNARVRVSLDTGHAHYAHVSTGAPPVDYYVEAAGDALAHVHVQDTDGYADRHWAPGQGTVNWRAVFQALRRLKTLPRLIIELRDHADIPLAAEYLASLGLAG